MRLNVKTLSFLKGRLMTLELLRDKIERLGSGNIKGENQRRISCSGVTYFSLIRHKSVYNSLEYSEE
uniref:Uncharacterized protein n=1 Tax=Vespula pensylvanica TaxID=30213 RepID=A0A834U9Z4_VESPE|nr:hypothetical protein H0235_007852 [Vespula pensylvanica]